VPRLRAVTVLVVPGVLAAIVTGLLAGCGAADGRLASVRDGPGPSPTRSPTRPPAPAPSGPAASPGPTETRTPAQLLEQARDAFTAAPTVRVTGTAVRGADAFVVDARLAGPAGGTTTITTSGQSVRVVRIGDVAYVGGDLAFWRSVTGDEARARKLVGSVVRTGADDPNFASYVAFTQPSTFAEVLPDPARPASPAPPTVIRGQPASGIRDQAGSTLYVATAGPAYPLRLDGLTDGQVVFLDFSEYGVPVVLRAPHPRTIRDLGKGS
jgi:hypothetical protein